MTRVLVTGGSGFIGTNLVEHYLRAGDEVLSLDNSEPRCLEHASVWRNVDILDAAAVRQQVLDFGPQLVFHLAARTDLRGRSPSDYRANTIGTENLARSLLEAGSVERAVFASSMLVCKLGYIPRSDIDYCPTTEYGRSKVLSEQVVRSFATSSLPWTVVRPTSIWGPWFSAPYRDFFDFVRRGLYVHPKGIRVRRSYGYVGNVVHMLSRLPSAPGDRFVGQTIYLADFQPTDIKAWADLIATEFGVRRVREAPLIAFKWAAHAGDLLERLGVRTPMSTFRLNNMLTEMVFDMSQLSSLCATLPYSMPHGVRSTCAWLKRYG